MTDKTSPSKPKVPDKADDKAQSERFIDAARDRETDESSDALDRAFKVMRPTTASPKRT